MTLVEVVGGAGVVEPPELRMRRALAGWIAGFPSTNTQQAYRRGWRGWHAWCELHELDVLTPPPGAGAVWVAEQRELGAAEASIRQRMAAVRGGVDACRRAQLPTSVDPFEAVRMPKAGAGSHRMLTAGEVHALHAAAVELGGDHLPALLLLAVCGLRSSEVSQLTDGRLSDSPWGAVCTVLRKGGVKHTVPIPPVVMAAREQAGRWPCDGPESRSRWRVRSLLATVGRSASVAGVHPHLLRHWHVTTALELGVPLERVQDSVGHADPATTQLYNRRRQMLDGHSAFVVGGWFE